MVRVNLREFYVSCQLDFYIEVSGDVVAQLLEWKRAETAYQRKLFRHKAHFSLNREDGIEHDAMMVALSPEEVYECKVLYDQLHIAIAELPDKQAKRIYAHFFLGLNKTQIARAEGVSRGTESESIQRGLGKMKGFLRNFKK